jgi:hypothetical protein
LSLGYFTDEYQFASVLPNDKRPLGRTLAFKNDLRIMGRGAAPSILVERSARAPLIWGMLQAIPSSALRPPLLLAFMVTCASRSSDTNLDPGVCSLVDTTNPQASRSQWRS